MFFLPVGIIVLLLFFLLLPVIFLIWFFQIVSFSFQKLGLTPHLTFLLLLLTIIGSQINIPLTKYRTRTTRKINFFGLPFVQREVQGIAINLGGGIIPLILSFYFLERTINPLPIFIALILMIFITHYFSRVIPGVGIGVPALIPPIFAALFSLIFYPENPAICAYISGTLGTLIGADLLNLYKLKNYPGLLSIGGAGVFDGIFLTGIIAVFLTAL